MGEKLSEFIERGDVVALFGPLASGKTVLIRGICKGLGVDEIITSPTFTIIHEYSGIYPVYHFDCFRIEGEIDIKSICFDDYLSLDGVIIIEWADRIESFLPTSSRFDILLNHVEGYENHRRIEIFSYKPDIKFQLEKEGRVYH